VPISMDKIKVIELFAGVGGFRLGLEGWGGKSSTSNYQEEFETPYQVIWSNQWEPSTKTQHASLIYENRWSSNGHSNIDIEKEVINVDNIPDCDLLVGGFPCQDYSVATTLKNSKGLVGKKGVLWWSIHKILSDKKNKPKYLILENVDRLLNSPSQQRGRDFGIILESLNELGYIVEWRIINAAEYGFPQRRKRIFILAYHKSTTIYKKIKKEIPVNWISEFGTLSQAFPVEINIDEPPGEFELEKGVLNVSNHFNSRGLKSPFLNTGIMIEGRVTTLKTSASFEGDSTFLGDILVDANQVNDDYFLNLDMLPKWQYLKGSKKEIRRNSAGFEYHYSEGGMIFPDQLNRPSRTIITGEGGGSPSRFKHVIQTEKGMRRLVPMELERLNMFPDNHTLLEGVSDTKRSFLMGNALVVGVIEKIGRSLFNHIKG